MSAPCESCPCDCTQCAWSHAAATPASTVGMLRVVRTPAEYGCVRKDAAIVVSDDDRVPYMQVGKSLLPLSPIYGGIIAGTQLERDIAAA